MLRTIELVLNEYISGTNKNISIKPCNTQMIHSKESPIYKMNFKQDELNFLLNEISMNTLLELRSALNSELSNDSTNSHHFSQPETSNKDLSNNHQDTSISNRKRPRKTTSPETTLPQRKRSTTDTNNTTKSNYKKQKSHSSRIIELFRSYIDLSHLKFSIPETVRNYLRNVTTKLDDLGDAFLHASRDIFTTPSKYRTFVPGQTLFQSNRCIIIRFTVRWFLYQVLHIENGTITLEHIESHRTNLNQKTDLKKLHRTSNEFIHALPPSFKNFLDFEYSSENIRQTDTIHIILRHTHGKIPHVMLQHLKSYLNHAFELHEDHSSTSFSTFFKLNRKNYYFTNNKLATIQETSGKHIDAFQMIPKFLELRTFISPNHSTTSNVLTDSQLQSLYDKITQEIQNFPNDTDNITLDKLIILRHNFDSILKIKNIQTNYSNNRFRAPIWHTDLLLCSINFSVVKPHFKGTRSNE